MTSDWNRAPRSGTVAGYDRAGRGPRQQRPLVAAQQAGRQGGIGDLVHGRRRQAPEPVAGGSPRRHLLDQPELLERGAIGLSGGPGRLVRLAGGGGIAHGLEARRRGRRRRIRRQPATQRPRVANPMIEIGEVPLDDPVQIAVERRPQQAPGVPANAGEPRPHDLGGVVDHRDGGVAVEVGLRAAQQRAEAHRRLPRQPLSKRHRAHAHGHDATGPRMGRLVRRLRRPGQQEPARRIVLVHGAPDEVPRLRKALPLVDEDRRRTLHQPPAPSPNDRELVGIVEPVHRRGSPQRRFGLADTAGPLQRDRRQSHEQLVQFVIHDARHVVAGHSTTLPERRLVHY